jgi:hypothetical protein
MLRGKKQDVTGAYRTSVEVRSWIEEKLDKILPEISSAIGVGAEEIQTPRLPDALTR